ncbi:hypothetical protein ASL14_26420 (plasmid) [Paenibacillus sp. IHB B 3084]|uniref:hypothetical protein n=1 Tax=Paenibacillus sp. IHB B 3084 TaxID=867076 RepID=UPI0007218C50|nr:hypothetical protein [Paenibacillus sp. IHB B 3084]ALP39412.1 hypothetical protein ASL14_26420 [Paenibacillus sp. IHB B 3084]
MKTCGYCGSAVERKSNMYYCAFCDMELFREDVQEDGQRKPVSITAGATLAGAERSTSELMELDSYYLTELLTLVRSQRKQVYNSLRIVNKGAALSPGFGQAQQQGGANYEYWTRKVWVIENILRERAGYYPGKITENYLNRFREQVYKSNEVLMLIRSDSIQK